MGRGKKKEKYRIISILLLMKCMKPILREIILKKAKENAPQGERNWTVDDFLGYHRNEIERKLQKFDDCEKYIDVLYPSDSRSDFGRWNFRLIVFVLTDICTIDSNSKYYVKDILNIRKQLCSPQTSEITRTICKEFKRRLKSARSNLYKTLRCEDFKNSINRRAHSIESQKTSQPEVDVFLERWGLIEADRISDGSSKTGLQKYLTINILLSESCCKVMRSLVRQIVRKNGSPSLDIFLRQHEGRIRRRIWSLDAYGRAEDMLLPPSRKQTQILIWDVSLLCWVLLNVCFLDTALADAVGKIRTTRNETVHKLFTSLNVSDSEYETYLQDIKQSINVCLAYLNDEDFSEDIHNKIEETERNVIDKDETIRRLETCQKDRADYELQTKHLRGQEIMIEELREIVKKFKVLEIPACRLELMLENCNKECENKLSKTFVSKINELISRDETQYETDDELTTALAQCIEKYKSKGWKLICSENGSVLLEIKCESFDNLRELYETHRERGSNHYTDVVQEAAQRLTGTNVQLFMVMHSTAMDECMANIVTNVVERTNTLAVKLAGNKTENKTSINIWMAANSEEKPSKTSEMNDSDIVQRLTQIEEILKRKYKTPDLSLTATLNDLSGNDCSKTNDNDQMLCDISEKEWASAEDNLRMLTETPHDELYDEFHDSMPDTVENELLLVTDWKQHISTEINDLGKESVGDVCLSEGSVKKEDVHVDNFNNTSDTEMLCETSGKQQTFLDWKRVLREELIQFYRSQDFKTTSPLSAETTCDIDDFYVHPVMERLVYRSAKNFLDRSDKSCYRTNTCDTQNVNTYSDIFHFNGNFAKEVYIVGDAGVGKTSFCKRLASSWCSTHSNEHPSMATRGRNKIETKEKPSNTTEDTLQQFDFLFFVSLGGTDDTNDTCIEEMISNKIGIAKEICMQCLFQDKCLIILDGLDEWSPQKKCETNKLPILNVGDRCTLLITSRRWAFNVVDSGVKENVCVVIKGIGDNWEKLVKSTFINMLQGKSNAEDYEKYALMFSDEIDRKEISDLVTNPFILQYLIVLWIEHGKLDESLSRLYENVINRLLIHAFRGNALAQDLTEDITVSIQKRRLSHSSQRSNCKCRLLNNLAQLAFKGIFCEKESTIFQGPQRQVFENVITSTELEMCLNTGFLSQGETLQEVPLSFQHKTVQEFFAALYISSNFESCLFEIKETTSTLEKVLELSYVFRFLSGMNPDVMALLYEHIGGLADEDKRITSYRFRNGSEQSAGIDSENMVRHLNKFMMINVDESLKCDHKSFTVKFRDIYLDNSNAAQFAICSPYISPQYVKSLRVDIENIVSSLAEIIRIFLEQSKEVVEMIHISDVVLFYHLLENMDRLSALKNLALTKFALSESEIEQLLESAPKLKHAVVLCCGCEVEDKCRAMTCAKNQENGRFSTSCQHLYDRCRGVYENTVKYPELQDLTLERVQPNRTLIRHILATRTCCSVIKIGL